MTHCLFFQVPYVVERPYAVTVERPFAVHIPKPYTIYVPVYKHVFQPQGKDWGSSNEKNVAKNRSN